MMKVKKYLFIIIYLFPLLEIQAQVTIGSKEKPNEGALLDLKEYDPDEKNVNAMRGLLLPRVELTDKNSLKDIDNLLTSEHEMHVGLVVYATVEFGSPVNCPGPYAWDGETWVPLIKPKYPDITMTDADGNIYNARWFSDDPCGDNEGMYWMTGNLYTTVDRDGQPFYDGVDYKSILKLNPGWYGVQNSGANGGWIGISTKADLQTGSLIEYGESATPPTNSRTKTDSYLDFAIKFGLLYSTKQAFTACPYGWRLPTMDDWQKLADALGGIAEAGDKMRHKDYYGYYYKTHDKDSSQPNYYRWGNREKETIDFAGFNALPSGHIGAQQDYARVFGSVALWVVDDSQRSGTDEYGISNGIVKDIRITYNNTKLDLESTGNANRSLSVRCVKE